MSSAVPRLEILLEPTESPVSFLEMTDANGGDDALVRPG